MQNSDLKAARAAQEKIRPLLDAFYRFPDIDMHNRMKSALVIMGILPNGTVRPPLRALDKAELSAIETALRSAGLL
jgi:4-hydroxy-tetrahydrodipicolinate synthase